MSEAKDKVQTRKVHRTFVFMEDKTIEYVKNSAFDHDQLFI